MKTTTARFNRDLLPLPEAFYRTELGELRRPNSRRWAQPKAGCPFHQSRSTTSFAVNLDTGGFYCFSCHAKGGDVVSFVMLRDKVNFQTAVESLGAWESHGSTVQPQPRQAQVPVADRLVCSLKIEGGTYTVYSPWVWDRSYRETLRRVYYHASDTLTALGSMSPIGYVESDQRFSEEGELNWQLLSASFEELRREEASR